MNEKFKFTNIVIALIVSTGIALAGFFVGNSFLKAKLLDRTVLAKGLSERKVTSDLAIWPIMIKTTGNNLADVNAKIEFLISQGFTADEITLGNFLVKDLLAQDYRSTAAESYRYIITANIMLKTDKIEQVTKANQQQNILAQKGVILGMEEYNAGPFYEFTKFNDIKTEMLSEAIKNARVSAEKFAADSDSKIGELKKANQGTFLISPSDGTESNDEYGNSQAARKSVGKKIRVVTTLEYYLKD
jgi:hypothetical protein